MENNFVDFFSEIQKSEKYQKGNELIKQGNELLQEAILEKQKEIYIKYLINIFESFKNPICGYNFVNMISFCKDMKSLNPMDMDYIVKLLKEKLSEENI